MKFARLFFMLLAVVAVLGCVTKTITKEVEKEVVKYVKAEQPSQPPRDEELTPAILERLKKMDDYDIKKYQFVLSGQITLNILKHDTNDRRESDGKTVFENIFVRRKITFPDKTPGLALDEKQEGDKYVLRVCFEDDVAKYPENTHYLSFSARRSDENAYFYLDYNRRSAELPFSEEKGTLKYGPEPENLYTLTFTEDKPHLFLRLERKITNQDGGGDRTLRGRTF